jgi:sugar lactone lactonase YvrE
MPSAASYTNKIRFAASVKNTKAQLVGGVGNLTQGSIAGCGLDIQYNPIEYVEVCGCSKNPPFVAPPPPPGQWYNITLAPIEGYIQRLVAGSDGAIYLSINNRHVIRKFVVSTGTLTTIAGTEVSGFSGDGSTATEAQLSVPSDVAIDSAGNIYIADTFNNRIRKVNASDGKINTIAGSGVVGFDGDGGPAIGANFNQPRGVAVDSSGNIYIADTSNNRIRKINASDGKINTILGPDSIYSYAVNGLATDYSGNLYISLVNYHIIQKFVVSTGTLTTIAGTGVGGFNGDGTLATEANLNQPHDVAVDSAGNVYIADFLNVRIRKVNASNGKISTIPSIQMTVNVAVDSEENIYYVGGGYIRKLYYA